MAPPPPSPPPSVSLKWASAFKLSGEIPAKFRALISTYHQLSTFLRSESGVSIISFVIYSAGTFLAITLPAWIFLYSQKFKKINKPSNRAADLLRERLRTPIVDDGKSSPLFWFRVAERNIMSYDMPMVCCL